MPSATFGGGLVKVLGDLANFGFGCLGQAFFSDGFRLENKDISYHIMI